MEDCICWLAVEIRSNQLQSTECVTYLDAIKEKESVFSISPQLSGYYWQMRWYWNLSNWIKWKTVSAGWQLKFDQINFNRRNVSLIWIQLRKKGSVFSISPQLSGYYRQMRWYWTLSNMIKSEDCICWLALEIRSNWLQSTEFVTYLDAIKEKESVFSIHLNCQDITDKWGDIELCFAESNRKTVSAGWHLKFDEMNFNRRNLSLTWMELRTKEVYFQYHLYCQDITDKWGDIETSLMESNRKTVSGFWQLKFDQSNVNQRNLSLSWCN